MKMRVGNDGAAAYVAPHRSFSAWLAALLHRAGGLPRLWLRRRHERRGLLLLDDQMLRDIGLDRTRIEEIATRPFWRA